MNNEPKNNQDEQPASLEAPGTFVEQQGQDPATPMETVVASPSENPSEENPGSKPKKNRFKTKLSDIRSSINIYLLLFGLLIIIALIITFVAYQKNNQSEEQNKPPGSSQAINDDVLDQLRNTDVRIGDPKQILSVDANAVFAGTVLIKGNFEVAGQLKTEGGLNAASINIAGPGTFQTLQASTLQLSGNGQIQGNLNIQNSLSVSGSGNFGGTLSANKLNIQSLEVAGDLVLSRHIDAAGGNPSKSNGSALGGGGTASVSGTDTAGTVTINTGSSPSAGCFITVNFTQSFKATPHVVITPVGSAGGGLGFYVNRTSSNFSICSNSAAPGGQNFSFDYIAID